MTDAKSIAEETLRLAEDATPGEWYYDYDYDDSEEKTASIVHLKDRIWVRVMRMESRYRNTHGSSSDDREEEEDFVRYIAHASPENMQTLAHAYLDLLKEHERLHEVLDDAERRVGKMLEGR